MNEVELRDRDEARIFLLQGLLLARLTPPTVPALQATLGLALEVATNQPLPPPGFLADLAQILLGSVSTGEVNQDAVDCFPTPMRRSYEDYVLGKLYTDVSIERGGDAMRRYQGRDRGRGLAFLVEQMRQRCGFDTVILSPALIKALHREPGEILLRNAWRCLEDHSLAPAIVGLYESLLTAFRRAGRLLGPEDVFELEHGTALQVFGQRVALRQALTATEWLLAEIPRRPFRPLGRQRSVPTRILDEDTYPVGGYASLSNRGSIESLLYSQLAFMEPQERPDLFDVKYLREELLYYSRDENRFLRRRRAFVIVLFPDLVLARFKDEASPWQRIVLILALIVAVVRTLTDWLSNDALSFEICFVDEGDRSALADERRLLEVLLREPIELGTVLLSRARGIQQVESRCSEFARRGWCDCLKISTLDQELSPEGCGVTTLVLGKQPFFKGIDVEGDWQRGLAALLQAWVS
jgi:hypothetical protein